MSGLQERDEHRERDQGEVGQVLEVRHLQVEREHVPGRAAEAGGPDRGGAREERAPLILDEVRGDERLGEGGATELREAADVVRVTERSFRNRSRWLVAVR